MDEFVLSNGMRLCCEEIGAGRPVICLHGWTSDHKVFVEPAQALADKAHFILYDHRGHGGSKGANGEPVSVRTLADDLNEVICGLGLEGVTLLGWSMGADVVLSYVDAYGCARLSQVVICDMTPKKVNDESWSLGLCKGAYMVGDAEKDKGKDFETLFYEYAIHTDSKLGNVPEEQLRAGVRMQMTQFDESVAMSLFNSMNEGDWRGSAAKIGVPVTYFYAVPGSLYPPELAAWYRDQATEPYQAIPFENSTHRFVTEHPEQFAEELGKLL